MREMGVVVHRTDEGMRGGEDERVAMVRATVRATVGVQVP